MKKNCHRINLFMVPAGDTSGMLKPKASERIKQDPETIGMYFHRNKKIVLWSNVNAENYIMPDLVKDYSISKTDIV